MASVIKRPIPAAARRSPELARYATWLDMFGLDSAYDYDPVWAKCVELGIAPTFHSSGRGYGMRVSVTNFTYNHIGHFAVSGRGGMQGAVPGRSDAAVSHAQDGVP